MLQKQLSSEVTAQWADTRPFGVGSRWWGRRFQTGSCSSGLVGLVLICAKEIDVLRKDCTHKRRSVPS